MPRRAVDGAGAVDHELTFKEHVGDQVNSIEHGVEPYRNAVGIAYGYRGHDVQGHCKEQHSCEPLEMPVAWRIRRILQIYIQVQHHQQSRCRKLKVDVVFHASEPSSAATLSVSSFGRKGFLR